MNTPHPFPNDSCTVPNKARDVHSDFLGASVERRATQRYLTGTGSTQCTLHTPRRARYAERARHKRVSLTRHGESLRLR